MYVFSCFTSAHDAIASVKFERVHCNNLYPVRHAVLPVSLDNIHVIRFVFPSILNDRNT